MDALQDQHDDLAMDDMDDLFFDHDTPLIMPPMVLEDSGPSKDLTYRLEELSLSGCCQKIAWSKLGSIAYISHDGKEVKVASYPLRIGAKPVVLNTDPVHGLGSLHAAGDDLVHVCWDPSGQCLAVVDILGRVSIHRMMHAMNNISLLGRYIPQGPDMRHGIVGMQWIPPSRSVEPRVCTEARGSGDQWNYNFFQNSARGWSQPLPERDALLFVTRDYTLHLMTAQFRQNASADLYTHVQASAYNPLYVESLLTHAAFAPQEDSNLLMVACDYKQLSIWRLGVDWRMPEMQHMAQGAILKPLISATPLLLRPITALEADATLSPSSRITHLSLLPVVEQLETEVAIVTARLGHKSRLTRSKLTLKNEPLHPAFMGVLNGPPKSAIGLSRFLLTPQRELDLIMDAPGIDLQPDRAYTALRFAQSDGSQQFIRRSSQIHDLNIGEHSLRTLSDVNMAFPADTERTIIVFSPNHCIAVDLKSETGHEEIALELEEVLPASGDATRTQDSARLQAVLAMHFATACFSDRSQDDLLALVEHFDRDFGVDLSKLLHQIYIATQTHDVRLLADPFRVIMLPGVMRSLGAQWRLISKLANDQASARTAWLFLDLQHVCRSLNQALELIKRLDTMKFELPLLLYGIMAWWNRTATHLASEMLRMSRKRRSDGLLAAVKESPGMRLLLTTWGRLCIGLALKLIHNIARWRQEFCQRGILPPDAHHGWVELVTVLQSGPINIKDFAVFVTDIGDAAKKAFDAQSVDDERRVAVERGIIIEGDVPDVLEPALQEMLGPCLDKLLDTIVDASRVMCSPDYWKWHSVPSQSSNEVAHPPKRATADDSSTHNDLILIDVITKAPLPVLRGPLRKCVRCSAVTAVAPHAKPSTNQWLMKISRTCVCGGQWIAVTM